MTIEEIPEKKTKKSKKEKKNRIADGSSTESGTNEGVTQLITEAADVGHSKENSKKEKKRKRKETEENGDLDEERSRKKSKKSRYEEKGEDTNGVDIPLESPPDTDAIGEKKKKKKKKDKASEPSVTLDTSDTLQNISQFLQDNAITIHGNITPILSFEQLDIPEELRLCLRGFKAPTPIQACSWPALMAGQDFVGIAETGR
jgi:ATP-dependent RNA helicase DBP3